MKILIQELFYKDGKVVASRFKQSWLDKHKKEVDIILSYDKSLTLKEIIYLIMNNINKPPKCKCCDNNAWFIQLSKGYGIYCSNDCQTHDKERLKRTSVIRYKRDSYRTGGLKAHKTIINRYGSRDFIVKKSAVTKKERYGDSDYNNPEQMILTNLEKYGYRLPLQDKRIQKQALKNGLGRSKVRYFNDTLWYQGGNELKFLEKNISIIDKIQRGPRVYYFIDKKRMLYTADFQIGNDVYEIKSNWTWDNKGKDKKLRIINKLKLRSLKREGYNPILVLDYKEYNYRQVMTTKRIK